MILSMPYPILIVALSLIMLCVVMPNVVMFAMVIQKSFEPLPKTSKQRDDELMERMYFDPKVELFYIPRK